MLNDNGAGNTRAGRNTPRSRRTVAGLCTIALVAFGASLGAGTASARVAPDAANNTSANNTSANTTTTAAAKTAAGGTVHYVRTHGHTVRVETHGRFGEVVQHAARGHVRPLDSSGLIYNGGPVEHNPTVYLVFWGSQWDSDGNGVQQYLQGFFGGLGGSGDNWSTITTQYPDNSGAPSFNGSVLGGTWVDDSAAAPANAQQSDIAAEAQVGAQHFGVSGPDADVFVVSPSGTSPDGFPNSGFCAWHDWNGTTAYTNMPYVLDAGSGCGANSVQNQLDGFSIVGGHEYAEAVTDPEPSSGWVDSSGEEIGDLCAWQGLTTLGLATGSYAIQPLWSNNAGGCVASG
jgi:serine protease